MVILNIAICDDNYSCLQNAICAINSFLSEKNFSANIFSFDNADDLIDCLKSKTLDIILLDIVMPLLDGMEAAKEIRRTNSVVKIVFLTSSPEFAIESYDVKASGYLLKPIQFDKLETILSDCMISCQKVSEHILVKTSLGFHKIHLDQIQCAEAQNKKVRIYLHNGEDIYVSDTFSSFEAKLTLEKGFFKCHRSYLIHLPSVNHFSMKEVEMKSGIKVPIARGTIKAFKDTYFSYMFSKGDSVND